MRLRAVQQVCKLSSLRLPPCSSTFQVSQAGNAARTFQQSHLAWPLKVRQGHSMSCSRSGFLAAITASRPLWTSLHKRLASSRANLASSSSDAWSQGDESSSTAVAAPGGQAAGEIFSPHPERKSMRNRPSYVPVASPYAAQNPVARVERKVFARVREVPQSVKKMNLVARVVRRMHIDDALVQMSYYNTKKSARALHEILMSARAAARHRNLDLPSLVVDEVLVLRGAYARRPTIFRAKGGVNMPRRGKCHVYVRLREVQGACMKTSVLRPWWERRDSHRNRGSSQNLIATRSQLVAATAAATAATGAA